ncbi:glutamyl-tRNA reductase [Anaerocolumna sp. AGMB13020]|uniref:glutamyl-tRNA reductase n=1 Tax=Anaerocolumna sp. AGMB13020 TaxID=3081750 RepID=UPI002952B1C3|nr:glutamyl-tRNA reductase [Anaerocolumna sp. AGMB13020]WOO36447.1 glutamyl-tRNA reductase [Anaerocolumna sp. AGMB13020]
MARDKGVFGTQIGISMDIYQIGISHKTAPVEIREQLAFSGSEKEEYLRLVKEEDNIRECVLITTCNRTEIYVTGDETAADKAMERMAEYKGLDLKDLKKYFLRYEGEGAVKHLMTVASGLDSMVMGEDEILGQVKRDYGQAYEGGNTAYLLNTLFREAISCSKAVKTETRLSKTPVSVGTLTAKEVITFETDKRKAKKVLIIGISGKMGSIVMKNLYGTPGIGIAGTVRNHLSGDDVETQYTRIDYYDYKDRYEAVKDADVIISATQSPHYTITFKELENVLTDKKKRLFIDLAVPRDIDKDIRGMEGIQLIDMDYFEELAEENNKVKEEEAVNARKIIDKRTDEFMKTLIFHGFLPDLERIKGNLKETSLETLLYHMKNHVNKEELGSLLRSLELAAEELKPYGKRRDR